MTTMRRHFHDQLDRLSAQLGEMVTQVDTAMRAATTALFTADAHWRRR
jgi:hypothetical protein